MSELGNGPPEMGDFEIGLPDASAMRNPYSVSLRARRLLWWVAELFLFKASFRTMYGWRRWVLRLFGARIGPHVSIQRSARIEFPWNLEMGACSSIGEQVWIYNLGLVEIGSFVTISQRAFLCTGSHDYTRPDMPLITRPIRIDDAAWVAADVYVGPGLTVGKGCVVAARSVVVKDLPAGMVCAGHPCRAIKPRLPPSPPTDPGTPGH